MSKVSAVATAVPLAMLSLGVPPVVAQDQPGAAGPPVTVCGQQAQPRAMPAADSGPVVLFIAPCFEAQGNASVIESQTYLYYIQLKASLPSQGVWVPYDSDTEKTIQDDFRRLWGTTFLDNLWVEVTDYKFANGAIGKIVTYNMEERQRVKIVDYVGSKQVETSKIDEKLKDANAQMRLDTFIDPALVRKVQGIVQEMLREKGFQFATVTPEIQEIPGGPKLVHLTFHMDEGPKVEIRRIDFVGNKAMSGGQLKAQLKDTKANSGFEDVGHLWSWIASAIGDHAYKEAKFDDDAEKIVSFYRDHGYIKATVGVPELEVINDSDNKKTRFIELRIPITEGERYKVGTFDVAGNTVVKSDFLKPLFKTEPGEFYSEKKIRKGMEKAREVYGTGGYFEFTGFPDYKFRDDPNPNEPEAPAALAAPAVQKPAHEDAIVDVTLRMVEGAQFFVNRITFTGNNTTHDNVIRREMRLIEGAPFNTEALKFSIKRLNQLGYFKPIEGGGEKNNVGVEKTPGETNKVDVRLKLEEQNRNQLTFGAGVSEFEGVFGQLSFQTANFLGRGESLTVSLQSGSRAQTYSLGFTEPFMFDRNMTLGAQVSRTNVRYIGQYTQKSTGGVLTLGYPLGRGFTRMFVNYSYQRVQVSEINEIYTDPTVLARNPFLADSLLIGQNGERVVSKVTPSIVYNTVDQPIFPTTGKRFTASIDLAGLGGNTNFYKPIVEAVWYLKQTSRLTLGMRGQAEYIHQFTGTTALPIFEKLFLGGEYSVRGFDIRTIGPSDPLTPYLIVGGDKSLLFNIEEQFTIAGPVRVIAFYDAGQVQPGLTTTTVPFANLGGYNVFQTPSKPFDWRDFKTSTGLEVRFFMPVLNVPFRLIFAYNPQRAGVYDNSLQIQKAFQFRFAVGSTF
ncbi:MAG TPA: BamA/TamA family outer membrane protein [Vicinamibacterales bacterium]|jgi:outer membrane protein insertion porin family|nr:BamA/TamA family outer membrane protein [Vicinamibacterales bacterium]